MTERIIDRDKSVIVAVDQEAARLSEIVRSTCLVEGIGGYKIGFEIGLEVGLPQAMARIREESLLPVIYDHQKAATDIPPTGKNFARVLKKAGIQATIIFPLSGPVTQDAWTKSLQDANIQVLVGGHMTHEQFLVRQGGYIDDSAPMRIFSDAIKAGVRDFVLPGNQPKIAGSYYRFIKMELGKEPFRVYAPGFISQGGEISEFAQKVGDQWHAIVGSAIYQAVDMRAVAEQVTSQIR